MAGVTISSAVRTNLLSLQSISSQQSSVQNRLATGKKVNSALDNATSFFTASSFTNRASSLSSLLDSVSTGVQTLQAANNGITSITSLVNQLRSTAQQALQSTSAYTAQAKVSSSSAIAGASAADLRGTSALSTSKNAFSSAGLVDGAPATATATATPTSRAAAVATAGNTVASPASTFADGDAVTVTVNGQTTTATYKGTSPNAANGEFSSISELVTALNRDGTTKFQASDAGGANAGKVVITSKDKTSPITISGAGATKLGLSSATATAGTKIRVNDGANVSTFVFDSTADASDTAAFKDSADLTTKLSSLGIQAKVSGANSALKFDALNNNPLTIDDGAGGVALTGISASKISGTDGSVLTINDGSKTKSYVYDAQAGTTDATRFKDIDDLNTKLAADGIKATATKDNDGKLKLQGTDATSTLKVNGDAATKLGLDSTISPSGAGGALQGKSLTFTLSGGNSTTVTFGDPADGNGAIKSLDDLNSKLAGVGLSASLDSSGSLAFSTTSQTASQTFNVSGTATGTGSKFTTTASTTATRGGSGADSRDSLVTQFNGLLNQIDTIAKDANFNGLNLLNGDTLSLIFNETNSSKLDVNGTSANSTGLGLSTVSAANFNDGGGINSILSLVDKAKSSLATQASKFGSNLAVVQTRQDFTKQTINTLNTGADNLVNADLNEEATNLLSLNTSQSLAQQALSLANQSQQSVLQLLR